MRKEPPSTSDIVRASEFVWRGPAPAFEEDVRALKMRGVTLVLCLKSWDAIGIAREREMCEAAGIAWRHVPMSPVFPPSLEDLERAAELVQRHSSARLPVYVHCQEGVDRTGFVVAAWRLMNGAGYAAVLGEMIAAGFHLGRFFWWLPRLRRLATECGSK